MPREITGAEPHVFLPVSTAQPASWPFRGLRRRILHIIAPLTAPEELRRHSRPEVCAGFYGERGPRSRNEDHAAACLGEPGRRVPHSGAARSLQRVGGPLLLGGGGTGKQQRLDDVENSSKQQDRAACRRVIFSPQAGKRISPVVASGRPRDGVQSQRPPNGQSEACRDHRRPGRSRGHQIAP